MYLSLIVYKYVSIGFHRCLQGFPQLIPVKEALCTMKSAALHVLRSPCFGPGRARRMHWFDVQWHESPRRKCWDWDLQKIDLCWFESKGLNRLCQGLCWSTGFNVILEKWTLGMSILSIYLASPQVFMSQISCWAKELQKESNNGPTLVQYLSVSDVHPSQ